MIYDTKEYKHWEYEKIMEASYTCGYCGKYITSERGMALETRKSNGLLYNNKPYGIFICTNCNLPTFIYDDVQVPGNNYGATVKYIPDDVNEMYEEARRSFSVGAYTGVILLCRTLLDHIAVDFGAPENKRFQEYVEYLKDNNFVTARSDKWIDKIRTFGNKATHRLVINTKQDAEIIIKFCEMLLKTNYEYPHIADDEENEN